MIGRLDVRHYFLAVGAGVAPAACPFVQAALAEGAVAWHPTDDLGLPVVDIIIGADCALKVGKQVVLELTT